MTRLKRRGRYPERLSMPGQLPELEPVAVGAAEVVPELTGDTDGLAEGAAEADSDADEDAEAGADAEGEGSVEAPLPLSVTKEAMAGPGNV